MTNLVLKRCERKKLVVPNVLFGLMLSACSYAGAQTIVDGMPIEQSLVGVSAEQQKMQFIRVLQYEAMLGEQLSTEVGLCLDESLERRPLFRADADPPLSARALDRIRRAAEACSLAPSQVTGDEVSDGKATTRLVGALRINLEGLHALASKVKTMRPCIKDAKQVEGTYRCFQSATGVAPTLDEQQQLTALFQLHKP